MKPPEKIYLQWIPEGEKYPTPYAEDVTWCVDKINDDDIEYHLAPQWVDVTERLPGGEEGDAYVVLVNDAGDMRGFSEEIQYLAMEDSDGWENPYNIPYWFFVDIEGNEPYKEVRFWLDFIIPAPPEAQDETQDE